MGSIGLVILLGCVIASRVMAERALRQLTPEEKVRLLDGFATIRVYSFLPLVPILLLAVAAPKMFPRESGWLILLSLLGLAVYIAFLHVCIAQKLARLELPESYRRKLLLSRHVTHLGYVVLLGSLGYTLIRRSLQ